MASTQPLKKALGRSEDAKIIEGSPYSLHGLGSSHSLLTSQGIGGFLKVQCQGSSLVSPQAKKMSEWRVLLFIGIRE